MANEKRLIDANAFFEIQQKRCWGEPIVGTCTQDNVYLRDELAKAPTVDAVEVVHGRWERCFEDWRQQIEGDKCSACGFEHYGCGIKHYHYCPNCGAKMDGERKDNGRK